MSFRSHPVSALDEAGIYRLMAALVVPRPIALVSTVSTEGVANLAPFSFFSIASVTPPILSFSVGLRFGQEPKDTLRNIEATQAFVVNVVSEEIGEAMNLSSLDLPPETDEFAFAGLTPLASSLVRPARVAESPAQFECRLLQGLPFGNWTLILGEVLAIHVDEAILDAGGRIEPSLWRPLGRLFGETYCRTGDRFTLSRAADRPDLRVAGLAADPGS